MFTFLLIVSMLVFTTLSVLLSFEAIAHHQTIVYCVALFALSGAISSVAFWITRRAFFVLYALVLSIIVAVALLPGTLYGLLFCFGSSFQVPINDLFALVGIFAVVCFPVPFAFEVRRELNRMDDERLTRRN